MNHDAPDQARSTAPGTMTSMPRSTIRAAAKPSTTSVSPSARRGSSRPHQRTSAGDRSGLPVRCRSRTLYEGTTHFFCTTLTCAGAFVRHPDRFVGWRLVRL